MPSFDINAILSAALATAVAEAVAPLVERIATLEKNEEYLTNRIAALEGAPSVLASQYTPISNEQFKAMLEEWDIGRLVQRVAALEAHTTVLDQHGGLLEALDNQEWFWHKVAGFVTNNSEITANDLEILKDRVDALESRSDASGLSKRAVEALIEQSMDHHLECYDHDNYDEIASKVDDMPDVDDFVTKDDLSESVRYAVQDLSFEIHVR